MKFPPANYNKYPVVRVQDDETFLVPAAVESYTIRPYGASEGKLCATLKAFVR